MPRIAENPTDEICPDYASEEWAHVRQDMIDAHAGEPPLSNNAAIAQLRATWQALHNRKVIQWNEQQEEDRQVAEERREEEERRRAEAEKELEDQRREQERKKPKINVFDPQRSVDDWIAPRPSAFALNKIHNIEYIELDYFTPHGCKQVQNEHEKTSNNDTFSITRVDDVIGLQPISSLKPSKNIRRDEELSWGEITSAKNTMLQCITKAKTWPQGHVMALASFFVFLETHPTRQQDHGDKIIGNLCWKSTT